MYAADAVNFFFYPKFPLRIFELDLISSNYILNKLLKLGKYNIYKRM